MFAVVLLVVYLLAMIAMGVWAMRKTSTLGDFFLGGRRIGPWISAFAYGTTYFSAVMFIGFAGKLGWGFGLNVLWIAAGNVLFGSLLAWLVLGRRTRRMTQNLDAMTMPEFLQARYGGGRLVKVAAAVIVFVFLLPYSASVFKGLGHLFEAVFHIPYDTALLLMIGITGVYLVLGGYFAITITDFVQGMIMLVGSVLMIGFLLGRGGGVAATFSAAVHGYAAHVPAGKGPGGLLLAALAFMTSFGTWGLPQMVQKFYAVKSEKVIGKAAAATALFALVISGIAYLQGGLSHAFLAAPPLLASGKPDYDRIIPAVMTGNLPSWLLAGILLLVLAASMSTLSSLVLVSASAVSVDLYKGVLNPNQSKKASLLMIRVLSAVFVVFSYVIARFQLGVIVTLMSLSWGVVAGAFMAPFLYGLYWKRATKAGILAGMATGALLGVVLFFLLGEANSPIASSIAMIAPFAVVPPVSAFTRPPEAALLAKAFDGVAR